MIDVILKAQNVSKQYRLGLVGTGTISHDLNRWWAKIRSKEDPYLKLGSVNDRSTKADSDYVWALQDINFEVKRGEVLGIIGKNGAGKSTLLKILSRVTGPTTGEIKTKGRIASLLEVGTGFHPELTGRENIYLNGAILGMTKAEIKDKETEIIEFSGCERYVDTPVKRYSSGMRVRLAFAVAAHLEPDILVIDEVLAVGDAEFQKKAIGKMQDISKGDGRTVLFVSHNMAAVKSLCTRGIVLENGKSVFNGNIDEAVHYYLNSGSIGYSGHKRIFDNIKNANTSDYNIISASVRSSNKKLGEPIVRDEVILFDVHFIKKCDFDLYPVFRFKDDDGNYLFVSGTLKNDVKNMHNGKILSVLTIPAYFFNEGGFYVDLMIHDGKKIVFLENDALHFVVIQESFELGEWMGKSRGALKPKFNWIVENL